MYIYLMTWNESRFRGEMLGKTEVDKSVAGVNAYYIQLSDIPEAETVWLVSFAYYK